MRKHWLTDSIQLLIQTGLRKGELLGLKWSKIDLDRGTMLVDSQLVEVKGKGRVEGPTKSGTADTLDLHPDTIDLLRNLKLQQLADRLEVGGLYQADGWVVCNKLGEVRTHDAFYNALKRLGARAGVKINPHAFRHFHGSVALSRGENIADVSKRLRHSRITTTLDIYAHSLKGGQRSVVDAVMDALREEST